MQSTDKCMHLRGLVVRYTDIASQRSKALISEGLYIQAWVEQQSVKGAEEGYLAVEDELKLMAFGGPKVCTDVGVMTQRVLKQCLESRTSRLKRVQASREVSLESLANLEAQIKGIKGLAELAAA